MKKIVEEKRPPKDLMRSVRTVCAAVDSYRDQLIDILRALIRFPSVNPVFSDSVGSAEQECQNFIADFLRNLNWNVELWEPDPKDLNRKYLGMPGYVPGRTFEGRPNLLAKAPVKGAGRSILLAGHVDVVGANDSGWTCPPFEARVQDGRVYGRGAVDMKGGLAAMLGAIGALRWAEIAPPGEIWFASVVDEEAGGMGTLALADKIKGEGIKIDGAIVGEPTNLTVAPLSRGILWGELLVKGRSGHIEVEHPHWNEGGAVDAIEKALRLIAELEYLNKEWARSPRKKHRLLPRPCRIEVAKIEGGHSPTSFADACKVILNIQYLPSERDRTGGGGNVRHEIEDYVNKVAQMDPWLQKHPPEIKWLLDADSYEINPDHPLVVTCIDALQAISLDPVVRGVETHVDAGCLKNVAGVPVVILGPGEMRLAHQINESLSISDYLNCVKAYATIILFWLSEYTQK